MLWGQETLPNSLGPCLSVAYGHLVFGASVSPYVKERHRVVLEGWCHGLRDEGLHLPLPPYTVSPELPGARGPASHCP